MNPPDLWLFDLGNTRLKWARADRLASGQVDALAHSGALAGAALDAAFAGMRKGDRAWIASVASPDATAALTAALARVGIHTRIARTQVELAGVRIAYAEPSRLGVDRFLSLLAAHARAPRPVLIASVGTALVIDLLDAEGRHLGGLIAPSPTLMRASLHQRAPHLPPAGGAVVDFAADTGDALASGAILSARALIARSVLAARKRIGTAPELLLSGGGADDLLAGWRVRGERVPDLVLSGLAVYAAAAGHADDR